MTRSLAFAWAALLSSTLLAAEPASPPANGGTAPAPSPEDAQRIVAAMERAAAAAQAAAEAAAKAADAAAKAAAAAAAARPAAEVSAAAATTTASAIAVGQKAPEAAAPTVPASPWMANVGLGFISLSGNARTVTATSNLLAERKSESWILAVKAAGAYGESTPPSLTGQTAESSVVAMSAGLSVRGDRRFTERYSAYLLAGGDTDHVKSIQGRGTGEGGLSIIWQEVKEGDLTRMFLRTDVAFRYQDERRFQYFPTRQELDDVRLVAPRVGGSFRYALSKDVSFMQDLELLPNVVGDSRLLVNSLSKLSTRLSQSLALTLGFGVAHDSRPAPGKFTTDTTLSAGLEVGL